MEVCATPKHEKEDDVEEIAKEKETDESSPANDTINELPAADKPTEESPTPAKESTEGAKETDPDIPNVSGNYSIYKLHLYILLLIKTEF